jgi:hypothetical protein
MVVRQSRQTRAVWKRIVAQFAIALNA